MKKQINLKRKHQRANKKFMTDTAGPRPPPESGHTLVVVAQVFPENENKKQ